MKKNLYFLLAFFGIVLLCLHSQGCFHHSGSSTVINNSSSKLLIDNREVSSDTEIDQNFEELSLKISKGSCENGFITVSQTIGNNQNANLRESVSANTLPLFLNIRSNKSNITNNYEIVSKNIYSIKLTNSSKKPMLLSNPAKITFNISNNHPTNRYFAIKKNDNDYTLIAPTQYTSSYLTFETYSLSDWYLVKEKKSSNEEKAPIITLSPSVYTNGKDSNFKNDLEIKVSAPYDASANYLLNLSGRENFPLSYNSLSKSANNSYEINLSSLGQPEISSAIATYTLTVKLQDYVLKDFPAFIIAKAEYTDPSTGISYSSQKRVSFLQGEKESEDNQHPFITSSTPNNNSGITIIPVNEKIKIEFSQSMNPERVEKALKITPSVSGKITSKWSSDDKVLTLSCNFNSFETYQLTIDNTACSKTGINLENDFVLIFGTPKPSTDNTETNTGSSTGNETGSETSTNTGSNTGNETGSETSTNTGSNTGNKTGSETSTNTGSNTGNETGTNTGSNTGNETGSETSTNTGSNTGNETGSETSTNTGSNTGNETGSETSTNTGSNTGNETGSETSTNTGSNTGNETGSETNTNTGSNTEVQYEKPVIISTTPEAYSENVALSTNIKIQFSKEMNKTSVENAISIIPTLSGGISTSWSDNKTLTIKAANNWEPTTSYQINISSAAVDSENQALNDYTYRFKTVLSPLITNIQPGNQQTDILLETPIVIKFSKSMNKSVTQSAISVSPSNNISYSWEDSDKQLTITNSGKWQEDKYIRISIDNNAKDTESIPIANPLSSNFKTVLLPNVVKNKCKPAPNSQSVATNTLITVCFNKTVNHSSAESAFNLRKDNSATSVQGVFSWNENNLVFSPNSKLETGTKYNITILSTYYDSSNLSPEQNITWSFTTATNEGEHWSNLYAQKDDEIGFVTRTDHSMVYFQNYLWIIGGKSNTGSPLKDIYKSSNGISWTLVTDNAAFGARFGHSCTVYNNKIWLSGGIKIDEETGVSYLNDIWNSSDGLNWTLVADSRETYNYEDDPVFSKRAYHNMLTYKNKLWVMLGEDSEGLVGDIWSSTDGITWTDRSKIVVPRKRASAIVFNDPEDSDYESIFVFGGFGKDANNQESALKEKLIFKDKNTNWIKKTNQSFTPRFGSAITVFNNRIWLLNGASGSENNPSYISDGLNSYI